MESSPLVNTTDATSQTSGGAFTSAGDGAFAKSVYVGSTISIAGIVDTTSPSTGSIVTAGGAGIGKSLQIGDALTLGGNALTSGGYNADTVEIQDLSASISTTLVDNITGRPASSTLSACRSLSS